MLCLVVATFWASAVECQEQRKVCTGFTCDSEPGRVPTRPEQHGINLLVNGVLGAATSAATRLIRHEPVWEGLLGGFVGGGVAYAGKAVAAEGFRGAGLMGREITAIGSSVVRNAGNGRSLLEALVLPVGPMRLYLNADSSGVRMQPRLDLAAVAAAGVFIVRDGSWAWPRGGPRRRPARSWLE